MAIASVALLVGGMVAAMLLGAVGVVGPAVTAAAPGVPAAPTTIFAEGFENVADPVVAQLLDTYTGPAPTSMTYTADPTWISGPACNGVIAAYNTTNGNGFCTSLSTYNLYARGGSRAIATVFGGGDDNQVLVEVTTGPNDTVPPAPTPAPTLQTVKPIPLPGPNRFVAFSVDVAATTCNAAQPLLRFYLLDGANEIPLNVINPCTAPGGQNVVVATPAGSLTWRVGRYATDSAVLFAGTQIGLKITNDQILAAGNDYVIDNIQVLDATPALDKSFTPTSVTTGAPSTLTFTITNTAELGAKSGWSFTDNLAAGLVVAPLPNVSTTCPNATTTAASGGSSVQVRGDLNAGQASCTVSVDVVSSDAGTYTNGPANITNLVGLNAPTQTTTLTVTPMPARAAVVASSTNWTLGDALPGAALPTFSYGTPPLTPMMGDWNGDGLKTVGTFESGTFRLNNENDSSAAEITFMFGNSRGYAVAGDYDGNGYDDVALYRYGVWEIRYLGPAGPLDLDQTFTLAAPFGQGVWPSTVPVAGDWNGDGTDGIGTYDYATGTWVLKNTVGAGGPDIGPFVFWGGGGTGSYPVVGDFGGIGLDTPGYRVGTTWTARTEAVTGGATMTFDFGVSGSVPLTW